MGMQSKLSEKVMDTRFLELAYARKSLRSFLDKKVEWEKIITCLEAARVAPSAENVQPWRYLILDQKERIETFGKAAFSGIYRYSRWAMKAPVLVCIFAKLDILANRIGKEIQGTSFYLIDIGISGEHFVLQAKELGLGTCWIGWFNAKRGAGALEVPDSWRLVALLAMGYPKEKSLKIKPRKKLEEIAFFNRFKK